MSEDAWPCPHCNAEVEATGMLTGHGVGPGVLSPPNTSHRDCPKCGAPLVRYDNIPDRGWRIDTGRTSAAPRPPAERSNGMADEHWQAEVWDDGSVVAVDVVVTGSASLKATVDNVREALERRVAAIDRRHGWSRLEALAEMNLVIGADELAD